MVCNYVLFSKKFGQRQGFSDRQAIQYGSGLDLPRAELCQSIDAILSAGKAKMIGIGPAVSLFSLGSIF